MRSPLLRVLLWCGGGMALLGLGLGVALLAGARLPIAWALAAFLAGFGMIKVAVGIDGFISRALHVAPGYTARESIGHPGIFALWVGFRVVVGVLALTVALWLLANPAEAERLMPR